MYLLFNPIEIIGWGGRARYQQDSEMDPTLLALRKGVEESHLLSTPIELVALVISVVPCCCLNDGSGQG